MPTNEITVSPHAQEILSKIDRYAPPFASTCIAGLTAFKPALTSFGKPTL